MSFSVGGWGGARERNPAQHHPNQPVSAHIADGLVRVTVTDGRQIITPLDWYPWLVSASVVAQQTIELHPNAVWWPLLDEGLSIDGMLRGKQPTPIR